MINCVYFYNWEALFKSAYKEYFSSKSFYVGVLWVSYGNEHLCSMNQMAIKKVVKLTIKYK